MIPVSKAMVPGARATARRGAGARPARTRERKSFRGRAPALP
jgi:hypothetical protein